MNGPRGSGFDESGRWARPYRKPANPVETAAGMPDFEAFMAAEFPQVAGLARGPNRRRVLQLMAASLALGGLSGCGHPRRHNTQTKLIPYVHEPPRIIPGEALSYASAYPLDGIANGILVTTTNGRPVKIEGNKQHPWSLGGTDIFTQAAILGLYDPDRSEAVLHLGKPATWAGFGSTIISRLAGLKAARGQGLRLLTGPVSSPTMIGQIKAMQTAYPGLRWHIHAPMGNAAYEGAAQAFGRPVETRWRFEQAAVVVSLDGDFLDPGPQQIGTAMRWSAARRRAGEAGGVMALHAAAPTPTLTLAKADYPLVARNDDIAALADGLLADINNPPQPGDDAPSRWRRAAAAALKAARGRGIVLTGAHQPAHVHAAVQRLNDALGNTGHTVFHTAPVLAQGESLATLVQDMRAGDVSCLIMLDTNPAYTAPGDLDFTEALKAVPFKVQAGEYVDETATRCDWHLPLSHPLERWGDVRAFDGTVSLMQPLVEPLYDSRSPEEILSLMADARPRTGLALLRGYWKGNWPATNTAAGGFNANWRQALLDGYIADSALPAETATVAPAAPPAAARPKPKPGPGLDLLIRPDPSIRDGRFATISWLQELPKPVTKIVWDNFIAISAELAKREQLKNGDIIRLGSSKASVEGPVWIVPGQQAETLTLYLGFGRQIPEMVGDAVGYDAYAMRQAAKPWHLAGVTLAKTGRRHQLASTQELFSMEGHDLARVQSPGAPPYPRADAEPTLYPSWPTDGYAWGMVIDLDTCIGCNACVVACQAENNIPVIGPDEVLRGRDMHWLRVDRYTEGTADQPDTRFMPVPCMHCEKAPCEVACPVEATVHDHEGLNLMVYNRCIGTRACEAYCPYKVRHFNFADYALKTSPSEQLQYNPEVTVRGRGVMEKCTYCVQRIEHAHIQADKETRPIHDGEVVTACQGACPARAISFGNMQDPHSVVSAAKALPRNYTLLEELNTRPRTTYLAALRPADAIAVPGETGTIKMGKT
jgi:Fe-S-cluster-containing dehydrogenase component